MTSHSLLSQSTVARGPLQFSLLSLMVAVSVVGVYLAVFTYLGCVTTAFAAAFFAIACVGQPRSWKEKVPFSIALLLVQGAVLGCGAAWYTVGEVRSACAAALMFPLAGIASILLAYRLFRSTALLSVVFLAPFVMEHTLLLHRLYRLRQEALSISAYAEECKKQFGEYPQDLTALSLRDPDFEQLIEYFPPESPEDVFVLSLDLYEGDTTNREYSPRGWYYYPD